jgi:hypothetical protein
VKGLFSIIVLELCHQSSFGVGNLPLQILAVQQIATAKLLQSILLANRTCLDTLLIESFVTAAGSNGTETFRNGTPFQDEKGNHQEVQDQYHRSVR